MATVLGSLLVSLGLDSSQFRTGSRRAQQEMGTLRSRMTAAGTAIKGALVGMFASVGIDTIRQMTRDGLEYASSLGEQATQLGVTTSELQRYRYIASQVGIEQSEMDQGLSRLNRTLGDLRNGAKAPADALRALGLSAEEIARVSRMTAGDALPMLADRFKALETDAQRASIAADLFGGRMGGRFLTLLGEGSSGISSLAQAYQRLGIELSPELIAKADEAADKMAELQMVMTAEQARIVAENADSLLAFERGLTTFTTNLKVATVETGRFFGEWNEWAGGSGLANFGLVERSLSRLIVNGLDAAVAAAGRFVRYMGEMALTVAGNIARMITAIGQQITGRLNAIWEGARQRIEQVKGWFFNLYDAVVGNSYIPDMVDEIGDHMRRLDQEMSEPARQETSATAQAFRALQSELSSILNRLFPRSSELNRYLDELETLRLAHERGALSAHAYAEARARLAAERMGNPVGDLPRVDLPDSDPLDIDPETIGRDLMREWGYVADRVGATNVRIVESFAQMAQGALSEIDRFVKGIKSGNVLDIVSGILGALDKIGGLVGGFNLGPFRFGGARAAGGPVMSRRSYLVGENGPEMFTPRSAGSIVPNHELARMGTATVRIVPSPYFDAVVDNRAGAVVAASGPTVIQAGAQTAQSNLARRQSRSLRR